MSQMTAVRLHEFGPPANLRVEDAPKPTIGARDVLIRVHAAGVNPVNAKIRAGKAQAKFPIEFPAILGWDVSGIVEAVGADSYGFVPGDAVFSRPNIARPGCYAEYVAVAASEVASKPISIDHMHAASVPLAAGTAWQALFDHGGLTAGQTVLIHAAAGGVGMFAVQLARSRGAVAIGTASAENREFLESIGVSRFIDYKNERFEDVVSNVDMVLDTMGGDTYERSWQVLKPGGVLVSLVTPTAAEDAAKRGMRGSIFMMQPNAPQLAEIGALIDQGLVKTYVEEVFPLSDASKAHEQIEKGHTRGKIVLKVV